MKEINDIITAYDQAQQQGRQTALATVVQVEGSSYRRPGARMLIREDGRLTGAISGGCLEGDALRKALLVMARQQPMLVTYDTMDEDDAKLGIGLGCNGIIHILIEPVVPAQENNPIELLRKITAHRQQAVLITLYSLQHRKGAQPGTCLVQLQDGSIAGKLPDPLMQQELLALSATAREQASGIIQNISSGGETAFAELINPVIRLIIAGAGNDVMPLVQMAQITGWPVIIADGRANYATAERFPAAQQVLIAKPEQLAQQIMADEHTALVMMTHNYNYELGLLRAWSQGAIRPAYIGVLGPRKKLQRMLQELAISGTTLSETQHAILHGPVGLNIGAETAEEIALSIMAEIKAFFAQRNGGFLRNEPGSIHQRSQTTVTS